MRDAPPSGAEADGPRGDADAAPEELCRQELGGRDDLRGGGDGGRGGEVCGRTEREHAEQDEVRHGRGLHSTKGESLTVRNLKPVSIPYKRKPEAQCHSPFSSNSEIRPHTAVLGAVSKAEGRRAAAVGGGEEGGGEAPRKHEAFRRREGKDTAGTYAYGTIKVEEGKK